MLAKASKAEYFTLPCSPLFFSPKRHLIDSPAPATENTGRRFAGERAPFIFMTSVEKLHTVYKYTVTPPPGISGRLVPGPPQIPKSEDAQLPDRK